MFASAAPAVTPSKNGESNAAPLVRIIKPSYRYLGMVVTRLCHLSMSWMQLAAKHSMFNTLQMATPPLIGSTPANFNPKIDGYRHLDILRMMVFYNETFDIGVQDDLPTRAEKFRMFLTQF